MNNVHGNLKSENSQDYAQKPQRNCTFMNSASVQVRYCLLYWEKKNYSPLQANWVELTTEQYKFAYEYKYICYSKPYNKK